MNGAAAWQQFLGRPREQQQTILGPQIQLLRDVLDEKPLMAEPLPVTCSVCKAPLFCTCRSMSEEARAEVRASEEARAEVRAAIRIKQRSRSPPPPPPGMVYIQQLRGTTSQELRKQPVQCQKSPTVTLCHQSGAAAAAAPAAAAATQTQRPPGPFGQTDWESVSALLDGKTKSLERCQPMIENALADLRLSVWLPRDKNIARHVEHVVRALPPAMRFKIGVTVDPDWRYYQADYAYCKQKSMLRDGVRYEGMIVVPRAGSTHAVISPTIKKIRKKYGMLKNRSTSRRRQFANFF